jgi:hypothetical protein
MPSDSNIRIRLPHRLPKLIRDRHHSGLHQVMRGTMVSQACSRVCHKTCSLTRPWPKMACRTVNERLWRVHNAVKEDSHRISKDWASYKRTTTLLKLEFCAVHSHSILYGGLCASAFLLTFPSSVIEKMCHHVCSPLLQPSEPTVSCVFDHGVEVRDPHSFAGDTQCTVSRWDFSPQIGVLRLVRLILLTVAHYS